MLYEKKKDGIVEFDHRNRGGERVRDQEEVEEEKGRRKTIDRGRPRNI